MEGAIASKSEPVVEIGQTEQDEGEQGATIPGVIEQDVQRVEGVLMEQVGLVEDEDGEEALLGELLDVVLTA